MSSHEVCMQTSSHSLQLLDGSPDRCVFCSVLLLHATHPWTINGTSVSDFDVHKQPDNDLLQFWFNVTPFVFQKCCSCDLKKRKK